MSKILVVEDDQLTAELVQLVLSVDHHEVIHVSDGSLAFDAALHHSPSLILLDVMLPQMDGYMIQMKLLEDERTKDIPVIIMTSKPNLEDIFKTATNVAGFIAKPFTTKELIEKVQSVLGQ